MPFLHLPFPPLASESWLILPDPALTIWVIVVFAISLTILRKLAFPRIVAALDNRRRMIDGAIDAAQRTREEAEGLLAEYRERLHEARGQADDIIKRARQTAESHEQAAREQAKQISAEGAARAAREIEEATKRSMQELRKDVAELTVLAAEKVTRKALNEADQRRLIEEALKELDLAAIAGSAEAANN